MRKQAPSKDALLLMGVAGAGKNYIAKLARHHGHHQISSGKLLRADKSCPAGVLSTGSLSEGNRALRLVKAEFYRIGVGNKFTLDGYPRTEEQCGEASELLVSEGYRFAAVYVEIDLLVAKHRILSDPARASRTDNNAVDMRHSQDLYHIARMTAFWRRLGVTVYTINNNEPPHEVARQFEGIMASEKAKRFASTPSFSRRLFAVPSAQSLVVA